jgi:hypothetical protein
MLVCDNGYVFDFSGSEEGSYVVADSLCPFPPKPPLASVTPRGTHRLPLARDYVTQLRSGRYLLKPGVRLAGPKRRRPNP